MKRSLSPVWPSSVWFGAAVAMAMTVLGTLLVPGLLVQGVPVGDAVGDVPASAKIAVIDLERAFEESDMKKKFQVELDADYQGKKTKITEMGKELNRLKGEMELVTEGSAEHRSLQTQILHKTADLQFEAEQSEQDFKNKRAEKFKVVLDLVHKKTAEFCTAKDIDIVLQKKLDLNENLPSWDSVFYLRPEFEITDDVIRLINGT